MNKKPDILIVGAGIIGCALARRLAGAGLSVQVLERSQPGREASWAAAGMLAPFAETAHSVPRVLSDLFEASLARYPDFVEALQDETGIQIGFRKGGSLLVATDYQEARVLAGLLERQLAAGKVVEEIAGDEIKKRQPGLTSQVQSALYFPPDCFIDPRTLFQALLESATRRGVRFVNGQQVLALEMDGTNVTGVRTASKVFHAGCVVNAAGAWAATFDPALAGLVRPIRGQIVQLRAKPQILRQLLHTTGCYIVPWPDGRTLIGSTLENVGFEKKVTAGAVQALLAAAARVVPSFAEAEVEQSWAGLRPDTSDNLPILGHSPLHNYIYANGHFRNGILLTPITTELIGDLILNQSRTSDSLQPFAIHRFSKK